MRKLNFPNFITTDQRILLSDWPPLAESIMLHSLPLKAQIENQIGSQLMLGQVLTDQQIFEAIQGPYSGLYKPVILAFSTLARMRTMLHIKKEDSLNDNMKDTQKAAFPNNKQLEQVTLDDINRYREALEECLANHTQQWNGQCFLWQMQLIGELRHAELDINDHEIEVFNAAEPLSDLFDRFKALSITPPKHTLPLNFSSYFQLKSYLLIVSALSRQHLPHDEKNIASFMKALKKSFSTIKKESDAIAAQQAQTIQAAIKFIQPASY
jgi:hypothetical protein